MSADASGQLSRRAILGSAAGAGLVFVDGLGGRVSARADSSRAGLVQAAPTISQTAMDAAVVVASPDRFTGIDPSGTTDSSVGLQSAINATPDGGTLVIPEGAYNVGSEIYPKLGKSIRILGYSATLVQTTSRPVFALSGTYDEPIDVSATTTTTTTGVVSRIAKLTLSSTPPWSPGDIIKLVSDDVIEGARPGNGTLESRRGEFGVVRSVSGNSVYLNGALNDDYSTNIRATRIPQQTVHLEGLTIYTADNRMTQVNSSAIMLSRLFGPTIRNIIVERVNGPAFHLTSCYGYLLEGCQVGRATDATSIGIYGYGILDNACAFGIVSGGVFRYVRHAYTDDTNRVAPDSEVGQYGRTFGTKLIGVNAHMTTNASFDTHHCSHGVEFISCTAVSGANIGSGQPGFQLRGSGHTISNGVVRGCDTGLQVLTEGGGGESWGHVVNGLTIDDVRGAAIRIQIRPAGHPQALKRSDEVNVRLRQVTAVNCESFIVALNASAEISDSYFSAPYGQSNTDVRCVYGDNSRLRFQASVFDFTPNVNGTPRVVSSGVTSGSTPGIQETHLIECEIRGTDSVAKRAWGAVNGPSHVLRARNLRFTFPFRYMPGENLDPRSEYTWYCDAVEVARPAPTSAVFTLSNADWQGQLGRSVFSADLGLFLSLKTTSDLRPSELPASRIPGQTLTIAHQGSGSLMVPHGSAARTNLKGGTERALVGGDIMRLWWDGAVWVEQ